MIYLDPTHPEYYTGRAPADERAMRADFALAHRIEQEAITTESDDDAAYLVAQVDRIHERWNQHADPHVREQWTYLSNAADDWHRAPRLMADLHAEITVDRARGFDTITPSQWRSQRQARELTGHGQWRTGRDPLGVEAQLSRPTDRRDPASPNHYTGQAASETERAMRADFARVQQLRAEMDNARTDTEIVTLAEQIEEINAGWAERSDHFGREWSHLHLLAEAYDRDPDGLANVIDQLENARGDEPIDLDSVFARSVNQVRGIVAAAPPSEDAARYTAGAPVPSFGASVASRTQALAAAHLERRQPIPGHAFAGLVGGREREGMQR